MKAKLFITIESQEPVLSDGVPLEQLFVQNSVVTGPLQADGDTITLNGRSRVMSYKRQFDGNVLHVYVLQGLDP